RSEIGALISDLLLPDFFAVHGNFLRGGDAQPYGFAFHRDNGDRHFAVRHHNSFTDLATEDEHESSSLSKSSSPVPFRRKHPAQPATGCRRGHETDTTLCRRARREPSPQQAKR